MLGHPAACTHRGGGVIRKSYGGHSERETPGPIPNPEVKPFSADGNATERLWESRTPPDILCLDPARSSWGGVKLHLGPFFVHRCADVAESAQAAARTRAV